MTDRDRSRLRDGDPELVHQRHAAEVDRVVTEALAALREIGIHDKTIIVGLTAASTRFVASALDAEGGVVTVRAILTTIAKFTNQAAEILLTAKPAPKEGEDDGKEPISEHSAE